MSFSNYCAQALLNSLFGKTSNFGALASRPTIYLGLSSTAPDESGGNVTEPSSGSYARVATSASDWNSASSADPSVISNAVEILFPTATGDWLSGADIAYFVLFDASASGNMLFATALTTAKPYLSGDQPKFPAGSITISLD